MIHGSVNVENIGNNRANRGAAWKSFVIAIAIIVVAAMLICCGKGKGASSDDLPEITDITADDVFYYYDGAAHGIVIDGVLFGDKVYFSSDGETWQTQEILYTEAGTYTVYFRIERAGYAPYQSSAEVKIGGLLSGISAPDARYIYDGRAHGIEIIGAQDGDIITYYIGDVGCYEIELTDVGIYNISYRVRRDGVGLYDGECVVVIVPDILGTYVNKMGTIEITSETDYDVNGAGEIDGKAFTARDGILNFDGKTYVKAEYVYGIKLFGATYYAAGGATLELDVVFTEEAVEIYVDGQLFHTLGGYNYCEAITGAAQTFRDVVDVHATVSGAVGANEIEITLSNRPINALPATTERFIYDGNAHAVTVSYEGEVYYAADGEYTEIPPAFTEVGEHLYTVLVLAEGYLPATVECAMTIYPNINGRYYRSDGIIEIDGFDAAINGNAVDYAPSVVSGGVLDGADFTYSDGEIMYLGKSYVKTESKLICVDIGDGPHVAALVDDYNCEIVVSDNSILITDNACGVILSIATAERISGLFANGVELLSSSDGETDTYLLLADDGRIDGAVIYLTAA